MSIDVNFQFTPKTQSMNNNTVSIIWVEIPLMYVTRKYLDIFCLNAELIPKENRPTYCIRLDFT